MRTVALIALLVLASLPAGARADEARPAAEPVTQAEKEHRTLESFAAANPTCREWSDGCATCMRHADTFGCSTPGIACLPTEPVCHATVDPEPAKKADPEPAKK